jgi:hypothetical protein
VWSMVKLGRRDFFKVAAGAFGFGVAGCGDTLRYSTTACITGESIELPGGGRMKFLLPNLPSRKYYSVTYDDPNDKVGDRIVRERIVRRYGSGENRSINVEERDASGSLIRTINSEISPGKVYCKQDITITLPDGGVEKPKRLPRGLMKKIAWFKDIR